VDLSDSNKTFLAGLPGLILASVSPRRRHLLSGILPEFEVVDSFATELTESDLGARRLCELNAERKAWLVAERYPNHLVLGADTLVFLDGLPLGKPADLDHARSMLASLSGRIHEVITGVCLVHRAGSRLHVFSETTYVRFRTLQPADIEDYLARVHVLDKAGSYALQEHGSLIIESVEGSHSNVIGLPVESLRRALETWNESSSATTPR
jgi:septum formation protein